MRAAMVGFGCRLNSSESEAMSAALVAAGWQMTPVDRADVVVINSCTITHEADADARQAVRRVHRQNPAAKIIVTGCWAQGEPDAAGALPGVAAVVGNGGKFDIVAHAEVVVGRARRVDEAHGADEPVWPPSPGPNHLIAVGQLSRKLPLRILPPAVCARARVLLAVQDGCDYRCSFCIVPRVRGPSKSLATAEILERVAALVGQGVAEIVVTGIHLGTWGRDLRPRMTLTELVRRIVPELGPARLRLSSIDPHEVDDELVDLIAAHPAKLCRHLHLPVQSCDDGVLRAMGRVHRTAAFVDLVQRAVLRIPGLAVSCDVIAGFPGEDDAAFERSAQILAGLPLAYLHVFPYSRRHGTRAATMVQVDDAEIRRRARVLRGISQDLGNRFRRQHRGQELEVVAHLHPDGRGRWWGRSDNDLPVQLVGAQDWGGRRWRVRLDGQAAFATLVPASPGECRS